MPLVRPPHPLLTSEMDRGHLPAARVVAGRAHWEPPAGMPPEVAQEYQESIAELNRLVQAGRAHVAADGRVTLLK